MAFSGDPPLRLYEAPPLTKIHSDTLTDLPQATEFIRIYLTQTKSQPVMHPNASFTHHGLTFPRNSTTSGAGTLQILDIVERGMRGEEAIEEANAILAEMKKEELENRQKQMDDVANGFKWEDKSVLQAKSEDEEGGSWAVQESVGAKNVEKAPVVETVSAEELVNGGG